MNGEYLVAARPAGKAVWVVQSCEDGSGQEYDDAVKRLAECVHDYGRANTILLRVVNYTSTVKIAEVEE